MLKILRNKKTAKWIWVSLAILIVPAFILWGSGSASRRSKEPSFAGKLFGKKISFAEYKDALEAVKIQLIMQWGDNFFEIQKYINLESQAWQRLLLLYEAKKRKLTAGDSEVVALIENNPLFQRQGRFDNKIYSERLQYFFHIQPRAFEEQARQTLMLSKLYEQETAAVTLSEKEIGEEYQKANEEIDLYYIAGLPADFAKDIQPSEEEIKKYFTENSLEFKQPLSFNMEFAAAETEDKAKDLLLRLKKKNDFSLAAKGLGLAVKETGLFAQTDPIPGIGWSPEILNLITKLKTGELSGIIHLDKYYYLIRLKEKKEAYVPEFEKVKDKAKERLIKNESEKIAKTKAEECLKKLKTDPKSVDFAADAKEYGLKTGSTPLFKFGSYIEGVGASDNFWLAAKELKENEISEIIAAQTGFYIIRLKSRVAVDEKKFENEKKEFSQKLLEQRKQEHFAKFTEELRLKAQ